MTDDKISWRSPEFLISLAVFVVFGFGYVAAYFVTPPPGSEQAIGQMQGASIAGMSAVIGYWIGSSRGSRRNADRADKAVNLASKTGTLDVDAETVNVTEAKK